MRLLCKEACDRVNQPGRGQYTMRIKCENPACEAFCVDIKEAVTMEPEIVIQNVQ